MNSSSEFEFQNRLVLSRDILDRICRTCLSLSDTTLMSEVIYDGTKVDEILKDLTSIQIEEDDSLPKCICLPCIHLLIQLYTFKQKANNSEMLLRTALIEDDLDIDFCAEEVVIPLDTEATGEADNKLNVDPCLQAVVVKFDEQRLEDSAVRRKEKVARLSYCKSCNKQFDSILGFKLHSCTIKEEKSININLAPEEVILVIDTDENEESTVEVDNNSNVDICSKAAVVPFKMQKPEEPTIKTKAHHVYIKEKRSILHYCKPCKKQFDSMYELKLHKTQVKHSHPRNRICPYCGNRYSSQNMWQHMKTHSNEQPYICEICGRRFNASGNLRRHIFTHTGERRYKCDICNKGFIQANSLQSHKKTHLKIEKYSKDFDGTRFSCNTCGRSFKRVAGYNLHLKKHLTGDRKVEDDGLREHACTICERAYKTKSLLKAHQLTHGEKRFLCSACGKGFVTNASLVSHYMVHTGEKPHKCTVCNKSFAQIGSCESHMLIHTGLKPYKCTVCGRAFTQMTHLTYHSRTHSGERPYSCPFCGKSFALNGNLTVHIRTHTGETPYICPVCGRGFYDSSSMKKHRRGHGEISTKTEVVSQLEKNGNDIEVNGKAINSITKQDNLFV